MEEVLKIWIKSFGLFIIIRPAVFPSKKYFLEHEGIWEVLIDPVKYMGLYFENKLCRNLVNRYFFGKTKNDIDNEDLLIDNGEEENNLKKENSMNIDLNCRNEMNKFNSPDILKHPSKIYSDVDIFLNLDDEDDFINQNRIDCLEIPKKIPQNQFAQELIKLKYEF